MGAESYHSHTPLPCANCGTRPGYRGNSNWNLDVFEAVCSNACGERLHKKRESGMVPLPPRQLPDERTQRLRMLLTVYRRLLGR